MKGWSIGSIVGLLALGVACSEGEREKAEGTATKLADEAGELAEQSAEAAREFAGDIADASRDFSQGLVKMFEGNKEEVLIRSEKALEQLSTRIKELEGQAQHAQGKTKEELNRALARIKEQYREASEQLAKMKDSTDQNWDAAVNRFKNTFGELQQSLKDVTKT